MKKHIPNTITTFNLLSGTFGIISVLEGNLILGSIMMGCGLIFDFFDGFAARLLKVSSPVGKELDSLADLVTFGLLPTVIMYKLMIGFACTSGKCTGLIPPDYFPYTSFVIVAFSAIRLARFNVDERQSDSFIGLPTPSAAMVIGSIPLIMEYQPHFNDIILHPKVLLTLTLGLSYLLVAELPLLALKFKNYGWKDNSYRYILLVGSAIFLVTPQFLAFPCIILSYIILSFVYNSRNKTIK
jgi:CDP-diacylglycerol--serine O-phosphatidyltransferase